MERQIITVDIAPGNSQVERLGSSQGDIGRPLGVYIIQNGVALDCSAYSAELYILKPDGKFYTTLATVDSTETNLIKWETALQETPVAGACAAQIRITAGDDDIGTARFVEFVEASPGDMGSASESEVALLTEYVRQACESATSAGRDATTASDAASSASGSASTATTAANTATQAATAATAAADRAEAVEESIPEDYTQLSDDVTELKSASEQLHDNVITESAGPAPIVSIADGADGMPMRKVEVAIEPVQDLHGYDAPWPAGGQLWDEQWELGYYNDDGSAISSNNRIRSKNRILISPSTSYYIYAGGSNNYETYLLFYDENDAYISKQLLRNVSFTTPANANSCLFYIVGINTYSNDISINFPSTITEYRPYSNVCPISGWTGAKVTRTGKNICDESKLLLANGWTVTDGVYSGMNNVLHGVFGGDKGFPGMRFKENTQYTITMTFRSQTDGKLSVIGFAYTDGTKNEYYIRGTDEQKLSYTSAPGKTVDRINLSYGSSDTIYISQWQVEEGSTPTDYEPYQGQTYDITFPSEAGTVYGGTLDVVTGTLAVNRGILYAKDVNFTNNPVALSDGTGYYLYKTSVFPVNSGIISNMYVESPLTDLWENKTFGEFQKGTPSLVITVPIEADTLAKAKDWLTENNPYFVYPIATPITYQLTPQEIKTLLGINNIWADTGDTSITYPADTKLYIDRKITEAVANALNA